MKYIKGIFFVLSVLFFGYFIVGQLVLPIDLASRRGLCSEYKEDIWAILDDGSKELVEKVSKNKDINVIETVLPSDMNPQITHFCFGGNDIKAYINGKLVYETKSNNNGWFGKANPEHYMMIPISASDAGKTLRIEINDNEGIWYQPYIGTEYGIWAHVLKKYFSEIIVAAITLILGVLTIVVSKSYGYISKKKIEITYLGVGVAYSAIWLVVNSIYRQVLFPNLSIASDFPFLMVMLIPYPFLIYMNIIQEKRFERMYMTASCILAYVDIMNCVLYIIGKKELIDTFILVALGSMVAIFTVIVSFIIDLKNGKIKEYKFVAFGLLGAFVAAIVQLVTYFFRSGIFSGAYLAVGLLFLLICAAIHTVHSLFLIEKDKTAAIMASEAKGKFLSSMSHEIRTPINAVLGMDEMILRESKENNIRDYALDIQNAGKSLLALINDILDISKIESGKMEIRPIEYDMSSMLNDTMNMIDHKAKEKDLYAEIHVDTDIPSRLLGDDIRIRQILVNILNNAVKYTNEGGVTLELTGEPADDNNYILHFSVKDTGIGIKEEDLPKLYARFERIEENRNRNIEGTGLGMNITLQLLELMGSKLNVKSEYGKGSCFYFDLKQEIVDAQPIGNLAERISEQKREYKYKNSFSAKDAMILVVDDNAVNRKVVRNLLKDIGLMIDEADSGERCLEMICEKKYDVIFLDHMMPGLDGIETLQQFDKIQNNLNLDTPVIALTANAISGAKEMYLKAGFNDFLSKPVVYNKLEKMLIKYIPEKKISSVVVESGPDVFIEENSKKDDFFDNIPDMNLEYAVLVNGNKDVLYNTIKDFAMVIESDVKEINQYKQMLPDEEALKQYRVKVHGIKASALLVGQMSLSGMARVLELAAINHNIDIIEAVHDTFVSQLTERKNQLKPLFDTDNSNTQDLVDINKDLLFEQLEILIQAVSDVDVDRADEIVDILKGFDYPDDIRSKMDEIYSAVINLDENLISEIMSEIKTKI